MPLAPPYLASWGQHDQSRRPGAIAADATLLVSVAGLNFGLDIR